MKIIGIIGAMEQEVAQLKEQMQALQVKEISGMTFCQGTLGGTPVIVVRSGIGKVNAAMCAQVLSTIFQVGAIINTGVAGSLCSEINIGDIVLSTDLVQHDMNATNFGYQLGQVPGLPIVGFEADEGLRVLAARICQEVNPDIKVFQGRIASGDEFVATQERKDWISQNFQALCTEMEGAAIAQVAYLNQVPFLIVRAISDKADGSASMDYQTFEAKAIEHSVRLMESLVGRLG